MPDALDQLIRQIREAPSEADAVRAFRTAPPEVQRAYASLSPEGLQARLQQPTAAEPSWSTTALQTAARVLPSVGGTVVGGVLGGPPGAMAGGAVGSGAGEALAEWIGGEELNPKQILAQGALGAIPFKGGTVAAGVKQGALLGGGGSVVTDLANDETPSVGRAVTGAGLGALFGGGSAKASTLLRRTGAPAPAPAPPATTGALGASLRGGPVEQGITGSDYLARLGGSLADVPPAPAPRAGVPMSPRMTRTGADVPAEIPPAAFAELFSRGRVAATTTVPKPQSMAELGEALSRAMTSDQPVLPPAAVSHYAPAVRSGTGGFTASVEVPPTAAAAPAPAAPAPTVTPKPVRGKKPAPAAPPTAPAVAGATNAPTPAVPAPPVAPEAPAGVQAAEAGVPVAPGTKVLPGPERAPDGSLLVPPGLVTVYDRLLQQGVDSFTAQRVIRHGGVIPIEAKDAVIAGQAKLAKTLGGAELDAVTQSAFDLMGQEYRAVAASGAEASARSLGAMLGGMGRTVKRELAGQPTHVGTGKGPKGQAGAVTPQLLFAGSRTLAGGAAGAAYGSTLDEEDPIRGAVRYGALGAGAGLMVGGPRALSNVLIANYLGQPKTQTRNLLSTAFHMLSQPLLEVPSGVTAERLLGRTPSMSLGQIGPELTALYSGLAGGMGDFWQAFRTGELSDEMATALKGAKGLTTEITDLKQWELPGGLANPMNLASRMLTAFDAWMFRAAKQQSIAGLAFHEAKQQGLSGDALWARVAQRQANPGELEPLANEAARRLTFKSDPSTLAGMVLGIREQIPAARVLIPFVRTVDSILQRGIELTPIGAAKRATQAAMGTPLPTGPEGAKTLGRELLGSVAWLPLGLLAMGGKLTGRGPEPSNESLREQWRAEGKTPYSVQLPLPTSVAESLGIPVSPTGQYWVPYMWLGPVSIPMSMTASAVEAWQESGDDAALDERIAKAMAASTTALLNQHYLQDVMTLGTTVTDYNRGTDLLTKLAVNFVPGSGFLRGYAASEDPIIRNARGLNDQLRLLFPETAAQVPPLIRADGEPFTRPTSSSALMNMTSPVIPSPAQPNSLAALFEGTGLTYPGRPDATLDVGGANIPQTPQQKADTQQARGRAKFGLLRQYEDRLGAMPPAQRGRALRSLLSRGSEQGTRQIVRERREEIRARQREVRALLNPESTR